MNNFIKSIFLIISLLAGVLSPRAERSLVINVNDASLISVLINDEPVEINDGANTFGEDMLGDFATVEINATEGNIIKLITDSNRKVLDSWTKSFSDYIYNDGKFTFNVTAVSIDEARTGTFTLTTDNPEKMTAQLGFNGFSNLDNLKIGENTIHFIPGLEEELAIKNKDGGPFYKVSVDGTDVNPVNNKYNIPIKEGMKVDVVTDFPDEKVKVSLNFLNDGKDFIEKVTIDGEEVTDYLSPDFMVQLGSMLMIYGNTSDYKFDSLKCSNGVEQTSFFDSWSTYIFGPLDITIDATKYPSVNYVIDINDAQAITVLKGSNYSKNEQELTDGVNNVSISSKNPTIFIKANEGYCIESVKADDMDIAETSVGSRTYKVVLTEGMRIEVDTRKMVMDQQIVIFAKDASSVSGSWKIQSGYNLYEWDKSNLSLLKLNVFGAYDKRSVYLNGERCAPTTNGGTAFELHNLKNGDIIKIYPNGAPEVYHVTFDVAEDVEPFTATHDIIKEFDVEDGLECFAETRVTIIPGEDSHILVNVNDNKVEKDEENSSYIFTVEGNDKVVIKNSGTVGINEIAAHDEEEKTIYNLQGIRVEDLGNLPAGIYIVNGKKVVK